MTKEEKIQEAWIELIGDKNFNKIKNSICENGWANRDVLMIDDINDFDAKSYFTINDSVRPKSLQGIENNNSWEDIQKAELINGQFYEIGVTWLSLENYKEKFVHQGFAEFKQNGFFDESGYFIKPTPNRVKLIKESQPPLY